jgi:hypothetical protein
MSAEVETLLRVLPILVMVGGTSLLGVRLARYVGARRRVRERLSVTKARPEVVTALEGAHADADARKKALATFKQALHENVNDPKDAKAVKVIEESFREQSEDTQVRVAKRLMGVESH